MKKGWFRPHVSHHRSVVKITEIIYFESIVVESKIDDEDIVKFWLPISSKVRSATGALSWKQIYSVLRFTKKAINYHLAVIKKRIFALTRWTALSTKYIILYLIWDVLTQNDFKKTLYDRKNDTIFWLLLFVDAKFKSSTSVQNFTNLWFQQSQIICQFSLTIVDRTTMSMSYTSVLTWRGWYCLQYIIWGQICLYLLLISS